MKMAEATYYGTGRRKTSVARVRLVAGQGNLSLIHISEPTRPY